MLNIYIDESGIAEKEEKFILAGVMVKDYDKNKEKEIYDFFRKVVKKYRFEKLHTTDIKSSEYNNEVINFINSKTYLIPFSFGTDGKEKKGSDFLSHQEITVSRYYETISNFIEYLLYMDDKLDKEIAFHFASRYIPKENVIPRELEHYNVTKLKNNEERIYLFNNNDPLIFLYNSYNKYRNIKPGKEVKKINIKSIGIDIEKPFFNKLKDNSYIKEISDENSCFYMLSDVIANFYNKENPDFKNGIIIGYSYEDFRTASLAFTGYYLKDFVTFFNNVFKIKNPVFKIPILKLINDLLSKTKEDRDIERKIQQLISYAENVMNDKSGDYKFIKDICLIIEKNYINNLDNTNKITLYSILQAAFNHLGMYEKTNEYYQKIISLSKNNLSYEKLQKKNEALNRFAISLTNIFDFEMAKKIIDSTVKNLVEFKDILESKFSINKYGLLAKIFGTYGQLKAFLNEEDAEDYFSKAIDLFEDERDKQIQYAYLTHFYLDREDYSKANDYLQKILKTNPVDYLNGLKNIELKEFKAGHNLELALKYLYYSKEFEKIDVNIFKIFQKKLIKANNHEHPFEKITGYIMLILKEKGQNYSDLIDLIDKCIAKNGITVKLIGVYFKLLTIDNPEKHINLFLDKIKNDRDFSYIFEQNTGAFYDLKDLSGKEKVERFLSKFNFYFK